VVRIQREPTPSWTFTACEAPPLLAPLDDQSSEYLDVPGVLRASLEGERIIGEVLTPKMSGAVSVRRLTNDGTKELGNITLSSEGKFSLDAPELEPESWK
jgi:hypothetical protein